MLEAHGSPEQKRLYLRQARVGRMDRHDEPDRAAGRLRPRRAAHPRGAGAATSAGASITASPARRSSSPTATTISPTTSSTWCWRAPPTRRRAAAASRCSWCRNSCSTPTASPASATISAPLRLEEKLGIHASPTCVHVVWRGRRRDRLAHRRGKPRPRSDVHDDEQRAAAGRGAGRGDRRARLSAGARLCPHPGAGPPVGGMRAAARAAADRPPPRCAPHAAVDARRRPRRCARWPISPPPRSTGRARGRRRGAVPRRSAAPIC